MAHPCCRANHSKVPMSIMKSSRDVNSRSSGHNLVMDDLKVLDKDPVQPKVQMVQISFHCCCPRVARVYNWSFPTSVSAGNHCSQGPGVVLHGHPRRV